MGPTWLGLILGLVHAGVAVGQDRDALRVRVETGARSYLVGEGFEVRVGVVGADRRPEVELPRIAGAEVGMIGTDLRPISASGIGSVVAQANLFVARLRVVARRPGPLEIPAIRARLEERSGRSRAMTVTIRPVPLEGRPAGFLGGIGRFTLQAEAIPNAVRVGQELDFRITVRGPAALGMSERPELKRYDRLGVGLRIAPRPDELILEPPSRTFVYRLRPGRAGRAVLPPVTLAAYDPALARYVTHVTAGVPIRVADVPPFDPASLGLSDGDSGRGAGRSSRREVPDMVGGVAAVLLLAAAGSLAVIRWRRGQGRLGGPAAARRYAARLGRSLGSARSIAGLPLEPGHESILEGSTGDRSLRGPDLALRITTGLVRYLELGIGRPPGALTPDEARQGVALCTRSDELAVQAGRLAIRCDGILYRDAPASTEDDADRLLDEALGLFSALGQVKRSGRR